MSIMVPFPVSLLLSVAEGLKGDLVDSKLGACVGRIVV